MQRLAKAREKPVGAGTMETMKKTMKKTMCRTIEPSEISTLRPPSRGPETESPAAERRRAQISVTRISAIAQSAASCTPNKKRLPLFPLDHRMCAMRQRMNLERISIPQERDVL